METKLILIIFVFIAGAAFVFCAGCTDEEKSDEIFKRIPTLNITPENVHDTQITLVMVEKASHATPGDTILMAGMSAENNRVEIGSQLDGKFVEVIDRVNGKDRGLDDSWLIPQL